jgi:hypothetical protein
MITLIKGHKTMRFNIKTGLKALLSLIMQHTTCPFPNWQDREIQSPLAREDINIDYNQISA